MAWPQHAAGCWRQHSCADFTTETCNDLPLSCLCGKSSRNISPERHSSCQYRSKSNHISWNPMHEWWIVSLLIDQYHGTTGADRRWDSRRPTTTGHGRAFRSTAAKDYLAATRSISLEWRTSWIYHYFNNIEVINFFKHYEKLLLQWKIYNNNNFIVKFFTIILELKIFCLYICLLEMMIKWQI